MGSRVRIRLFHILHFVMDFLFPLLKNSKSGVDDRGHWLRICQAQRRGLLLMFIFFRKLYIKCELNTTEDKAFIDLLLWLPWQPSYHKNEGSA